MNFYYPVFLDLRGRNCLVVGGGAVATRKVEGLLSAEAKVTVVSPDITPGLRAHVDAGRVAWRAREFTAADLEGALLVIAATDHREVNQHVAVEARRRGLLVNAVDDPPNCDWIAPAVVRRGDLVVAISTGGRSPAFARRVRQDLEKFLGDHYALLLDLLADSRAELRRQNRSVDPDVWQQAMDDGVIDHLRNGDVEGARRRLLASLLSDEPGPTGSQELGP